MSPMVEGAAMMLADLASRLASGEWHSRRGSNAFDGGSPFYRTYETADGCYVAVEAIEPRFYQELLAEIGLEDIDPAAQYDQATWPSLTERIASIFCARRQEEWNERFAKPDACVTPVLDWAQLSAAPHIASRALFHSNAYG